MTTKKRDRRILTGRVGEDHGQDYFPAKTDVPVLGLLLAKPHSLFQSVLTA
jgi:hypothetical protein